LFASDPSTCCNSSECVSADSSRQSKVNKVPVSSGAENPDVTSCQARSAYVQRVVDLHEDDSRTAARRPGLGYGAGRPRGGVRFPAEARDFSLSSPRRLDRPWGPLSLLTSEYRRQFPRG
jgi:hypothetical protein